MTLKRFALMLTARVSGQSNIQMLERYQRGLRETLPQAIKAAGRLIAVSLGTSTVPYGVGDGARKRGENAVIRDINNVYATPARVAKSFAAAGQDVKGKLFLAALAQRRVAQAQKLVDAYCPSFRGVPIRAFDNGAAHKAARKYHGRVAANQRPIIIVQTPRLLQTYIRLQVSHVGEAKAGWAACALALGGYRGLPQWVTRHVGSLSSGSVAGNLNGPSYLLRMINQVRYAGDALSSGKKAEAVQFGLNRFVRGKLKSILAGRIPAE
jgi:hypothetical protein